VKPEVGKVYIIGPHCDGLYSTEVIKEVFEDGSFTSYFRGNAHLQRHNPSSNECWKGGNIVAEVGMNTEKHWWKPEELGL